MREKSQIHSAEVLGVNFEVVVTNNITESYNQPARLKQMDNEKLGEVNYAGLTCARHRYVLILFDRSCICHDLIAHEARHATDFMLEMVSWKYGKKADKEVCAVVAGYVARTIYRDIKKFRVNIKW